MEMYSIHIASKIEVAGTNAFLHLGQCLIFYRERRLGKKG